MDDLLLMGGLVVFGIVVALAVVLGSFLGSYKAHEIYDKDRQEGRKRPW